MTYTSREAVPLHARSCLLGVWLLLLAAGPGLSSETTLGRPASGIFERTEPNLAAGERALRDGRPEDALRAFREARTETRDERAIVEYDVGQALLQQGTSEAEASAQPGDEAQGAGTKQVFEEAAEAFDRAYGLTSDPLMRSASALAAGNARAQKGDLQGAVDSFRKSIIADPKNAGARKNLASVLRALAAQPPPPPSESDENGESDENPEQDSEQQDEKQEGDSSGKEEGEKSSESQPGDERENNQPDPDRTGEREEEGEGSQSESKPKPKPKPGDGEQGDKEQQKQGRPESFSPEERAKEQAQRLLDQMRNREKPLVPLWMRGKSSSKPPPEKDW